MPHVQVVSNFLDKIGLFQAWKRFEVDFTHTYELNNQSFVSKIDHFFWSESLDEAIVDAGVIHSSQNPSDHCPIYCVPV